MLNRTQRAILAAVACTFTGCSPGASDVPGGSAADDSVTVKVSEDGRACVVSEQAIACSGLSAHLADTLAIDRSRIIVLSDDKTGRTDNAVSELMEQLKKAGYQSFMAISFVTQPGQKAP